MLARGRTPCIPCHSKARGMCCVVLCWPGNLYIQQCIEVHTAGTDRIGNGHIAHIKWHSFGTCFILCCGTHSIRVFFVVAAVASSFFRSAQTCRASIHFVRGGWNAVLYTPYTTQCYIFFLFSSSIFKWLHTCRRILQLTKSNLAGERSLRAAGICVHPCTPSSVQSHSECEYTHRIYSMFRLSWIYLCSNFGC